jgi:hypothetical protein
MAKASQVKDLLSLYHWRVSIRCWMKMTFPQKTTKKMKMKMDGELKSQHAAAKPAI